MRGNQLALLIHESMKSKHLIEVTLNSRKVYIGFPVEFELGADEGDLAFVPVFSGYRNPENQQLHMTMFYTKVSRDLEDLPPDNTDWKPEQFRLILPMREIVSLRTFNFQFYDRITGFDDSIKAEASH